MALESLFLIHEAVEAAQAAMLVAQAKGPDRPIVYVNAAFEKLTGYLKRDVLGQDCRFLQGDDRDQPSLSGLARDLAEGRSTRALLRNYRKDGSSFLNDVRISPIRNGHGETTHFVGIQQALDYPELSRLRAEAEARVAALTDRERTVFEHVVCGCPTKVVALEMGLSPRTVEKYRLRMQRKMGTSNLALLVRYGMALGRPFGGS